MSRSIYENKDHQWYLSSESNQQILEFPETSGTPLESMKQKSKLPWGRGTVTFLAMLPFLIFFKTQNIAYFVLELYFLSIKVEVRHENLTTLKICNWKRKNSSKPARWLSGEGTWCQAQWPEFYSWGPHWEDKQLSQTVL